MLNLDPSVDADAGVETTFNSARDIDFDFGSAQQHVLGVCDELLNTAERARNFPPMNCPLYQWRDFLLSRGAAFPAEAATLPQLLEAWEADERFPSADVRLVPAAGGGREVAWVRVRVYSTMATDMGAGELKENFDFWEDSSRRRTRAPPPRASAPLTAGRRALTIRGWIRSSTC